MTRAVAALSLAVSGVFGVFATLTPVSAEPGGGLAATAPPEVRGTAREGEVLRAFPGRWSPQRETTTYRWLRDGEPIPRARARRYRLTWADVGARISVQVTAAATGHAAGTATSRATKRIDYRRPVRRRVTYSVETRGAITASVREFRRLAQETYDDARGWRAGGVRFRQVRRGGHFTLVLAQASTLPSFSSTCSTMWSCRIGRFVVINQDRWLHASPAWNAAHRSLRDYRHLVVNHETGHWLGRGHVGCPGRGPAPVMMQQSKGTGGCHFNPWPLAWER